MAAERNGALERRQVRSAVILWADGSEGEPGGRLVLDLVLWGNAVAAGWVPVCIILGPPSVQGYGLVSPDGV